MFVLEVEEGFVPFDGHRTWYRAVGGGEGTPLLCLHGGPGFPSDYLEPLERLADDRRVIFYDQLGCGRSDHPKGVEWSVELFVRELAVLRQRLGLEEVVLLGHSWGGMLALEHVLAGAAGVRALVLCNTLARVSDWIAEARRLRSLLPPEAREALDRHEAAGTTDHPEYQKAKAEYYRRHVCRLDPWPPCLCRSFDYLHEDPSVYRAMWGPSEFTCTGRLCGYDVVGRLGEVAAPTLLVSGEHDEATPLVVGRLHRGIRGSQWELMDGCSHMPHLEDTERFLSIVRSFLDLHG